MQRIGRKDKTPLSAGMAILIEAGVYLVGVERSGSRIPSW
jgi:hypothetical protein